MTTANPEAGAPERLAEIRAFMRANPDGGIDNESADFLSMTITRQRSLLDARDARIATLTEEGWQPIESAPKDALQRLLWGPEWWHPEPGNWDAEPYHKKPRAHWTAFKHERLQGVAWMRANQPTHWRLLSAPAATETKGE